MAQFPVPRPTPLSIRLVLPALLAILLLIPAADAQAASRRVATTAEAPSLGERVLTDLRGRTLYSLSAETRGRFICSNPSRLASWKPLLVPAGVKPKGPVALKPSNGPKASSR